MAVVCIFSLPLVNISGLGVWMYINILPLLFSFDYCSSTCESKLTDKYVISLYLEKLWTRGKA